MTMRRCLDKIRDAVGWAIAKVKSALARLWRMIRNAWKSDWHERD